MSTKRNAESTGETDLNTPEAVERFRRAAAYLKKHGRTKETALKAPVDAGIYNKSGKLKKKFRP